MADKITEAKAAVALVLGAISSALGWFGWLMVLYIFSMVADWITGSAAAMKNGEWSSTRSKDGIWHKIGSIIIVMVAAMFDVLIGSLINHIPGIVLPFTYNIILCPVVTVWYMVAELGSIAENAAKLGAPVPSFLRKAIHTLHEITDAAGETMIHTDREGENKSEQE